MKTAFVFFLLIAVSNSSKSLVFATPPQANQDEQEVPTDIYCNPEISVPELDVRCPGGGYVNRLSPCKKNCDATYLNSAKLAYILACADFTAAKATYDNDLAVITQNFLDCVNETPLEIEQCLETYDLNYNDALTNFNEAVKLTDATLHQALTAAENALAACLPRCCTFF